MNSDCSTDLKTLQLVSLLQFLIMHTILKMMKTALYFSQYLNLVIVKDHSSMPVMLMYVHYHNYVRIIIIF